jgi:PBP1b-binding outer membrane lipoprotein LpoB
LPKQERIVNKILTNLFAVALIGCATIFITGCATMGGDRTVNVTGDQIAQKLNEKLALPISLLKVFDVNLSNSVVTFDKTTGRMITTMDSNLSSQMFDKSLAGKLGISGKLRFDAATNAVVLDEPKIENVSFNGADGKFNDLFNALAKTVGGEMLTGLTLYTVKPEDLTFGGTSYSPKDMVVTENGLQLTLTPAK